MVKIEFFPATSPYSDENPEHWRSKLHRVIFGTETPAGKRFDLILLVCIILSVFIVMLESVGEIRRNWGSALIAVEWVFTLAFSIEYIARLLSVKKPLRYAFSFFGLIDFISILPTFLALFIPGTAPLMVVRILRMLRIFRILRMVHFLGEANTLLRALRSSSRKIGIFMFTVLTIVVVLGTIMYIIEDSEAGFTSIPRSIYWAIVTLTTVGYGDIAPVTALGQMVAAAIMILGYSIIAVPTGIVSSELVKESRSKEAQSVCGNCGHRTKDVNNRYCSQCGEPWVHASGES